MEISIRLSKSLARLNNDKKDAVLSIEEGYDMEKLINTLDENMPGIKAEVLTKTNDIADSINIYVNGENIRYLQGLSTFLKDKDQIGIIPAAAAG